MSKEMKTLEERVLRLEREKKAWLRLSRNRSAVTIKPHAGTGKSEAVAITLLSDVHYEEEVKPQSVFHRNRYTLDIASQRMHEYFSKVARLIKKEQQDVSIKECIVHLGGDFITGAIHEEYLETCQLRPIEATLAVQSCIAGGIKHLLDNSDVRFTFVCSTGNHGRTTHKVRNATEQGHSLEWFMYRALAASHEGNKRVRFIMEESYHTYMLVYGRTLRFHHGHAVRYQGGVGGIHIPLNKAIARWNTVNRADIDFLGHLHQHVVANNYVVNGSMIGYNAYAMKQGFSFEKPKQAFVLLDRDRGLTVSMPVVFTC